MMSRLRLVMAWLVMAALPLQGLAAATMAFCAGPHHGQAAQAAASSGVHQHADGATHDHHGQPAGVAQAGDANAGDASGPVTASKALPDAGHKCGVCAACCSSVAIVQSAYEPAFAPLPQAASAEAVVPVRAAPSQVPDKPPRA